MNLRGQEVTISGKTIKLSIRKPLGNVFSVNDKIYEYLKKGYELVVSLDGKEVKLDGSSSFLRREEVKSKYLGSPSWYRYWYRVQNNNQLSFV
jgi:hypothetical protein